MSRERGPPGHDLCRWKRAVQTGNLLAAMKTGSGILLAIIAISFCMGLLFIRIVPFRSFPDEADHLAYAQFIRTHHSIPPLAREGEVVRITESFQPPLFYICASFLIFSKDFSTVLFTLRMFSLTLAMLAIWLIWKSASLVYPRYIPVLMLASASAAFNPEYIWIHSGVSNMSMSTFTCALTLYLSLRIMDEKESPLRGSILIGLAAGAMLLSRVLNVCLVPACAIAILYRTRRKSLAPLAAFGASTVIVCGWWYLRNWMDYGDPLLWHIHQTTMGKTWARNATSIRIEDLLTAPAFLHASFWAYFGRNEYHARIADYAVYLLIVALSAVGVAEILFRRSGDSQFRERPFDRPRFVFLIVCASLAILEIMVMQFKIALPQGRYLYMAYVALGTLFGCGLLKIVPVGRREVSSKWITYFLLAFCVYILFRYAVPHYL
jgi:hypothetical protein